MKRTVLGACALLSLLPVLPSAAQAQTLAQSISGCGSAAQEQEKGGDAQKAAA